MMKRIERITLLLLTFLMVGAILILPAGAVGTEHYYTYNFDWNYNALPSPDAYAVRYTISANELGLSNFDASRVVTRLEAAVVMDAAFDPFSMFNVDYNGNFR